MSLHADLFLGIDTGGTFTDGVLLEPATRKIMKTAKVLTTHADLRVCIAEVLDQLAVDAPGTIALVSLSTTPVVMMRGDGSIVRAEYAGRRPVEIIHSGPSTSTIAKPGHNGHL